MDGPGPLEPGFRRVRLPADTEISLGGVELKLLMAFADVPEDHVEMLESKLGGKLEDAQIEWMSEEAVMPAPLPPNLLGAMLDRSMPMVAADRVGDIGRTYMAQQIVHLFLNARLRAAAMSKSEVGEDWKTGEDGQGFQLQLHEANLYQAATEVLTQDFKKMITDTTQSD